MSLMHQMIVEVKRCMEKRGMPEAIHVCAMTKHEMETEMRARQSFTNAYTSKTAQDLVINRLHEVDDKGKPVIGGWEIPIYTDENVPRGQFWVGVNGYDISRTRIGRKISRDFIKFPNGN